MRNLSKTGFRFVRYSGPSWLVQPSRVLSSQILKRGHALNQEMMSLSLPETQADILVAGAGAAGLSPAIALAQAGFSVFRAGHVDTRFIFKGTSKNMMLYVALPGGG